MPGFEVTDTLSSAPRLERPLLKAHKALPRRRDVIRSITPIEILPSDRDVEQSNGAAVPSLPLTPPNQIRDHYETSPPDLTPRPSPLNHDLAMQAARTRQFSPPTPDTTPPRVRASTGARPAFLAQTSMSSRTESFKTAREEFTSDEEPESRNRSTHSLVQRNRQKPLQPKRSPLANGLPVRPDGFGAEEISSSRRVEQSVFDSFDGEWARGHEGGSATSLRFKSPWPRGNHADVDPEQQSQASDVTEKQLNSSLTREKSLRDRVHDSQETVMSPSLEKFGEDIGWLLPEREQRLIDKVNTWRLSAGSTTTSTIEAMVIDSPPKIRRTLRHSGKRASLRSVSTPNPQSTRTSLESSGESQHRLVHKSARITNRNRLSMASDMSVSASVTSSQLRQVEVIPVVVIPERRSSLKSSAPNSRNHSKSRSQSSGRRPTTAPDGRMSSMDMHLPYRKRTMSESLPSSSRFTDQNSRGRGCVRPPVPPRSSSLSAPTSRNNSRTTSLTSESLRRHTEAMNVAATKKENNERPADPNLSPRIVLPDSRPEEEALHRQSHYQDDDMEKLRPPSLHFTQPSVVSSSPGPVEISEATAVTFFPHNNRSLLLIDPNRQSESRAVRALRGRPLDAPLNPKTPEQSPTPVNVDSPLKNPRPPPKPPAFKVIPPTPMDETERQLGGTQDDQEGSNSFVRRLGSVRRAMSGRRRSESATFTRSFSTRTARNRKAGKDIDGRLHPLWRPRGFWEDFGDTDDERVFTDGIPAEQEGKVEEDDVFVSNSLGLPQKRVIFNGPLALARRLSKSRKSGNGRQKSSQGNLRGGSLGSGIIRPRSPYQRRVRLGSRFGIHLRFVTLRDVQQRLRHARQLRQEEKLETRREKLKQSIGEKRMLIDPYSVLGPYNQVVSPATRVRH
jgi:hypothetical protein